MGEPLHESTIKHALGDRPVSVRVLSVTDSTNNEAKRHALSGTDVPTAIFAEEQTAGRGRMGRSFFSPPHTGIYLSLLLPDSGVLTDTVDLTTAAAVSVLRAIRTVTGISVGIKWVNDLYHRQKKVCGILAESFLAGDKRYIVIGVGINLYTEEFPEELAERAGSLSPADGSLRTALAAQTVAELYDAWKHPNREELMREYRAASVVLGRSVIYTENGREHRGIAEAIDERGRLLVRLSDGTLATLASGEISLQTN
ncbi:MAG: biotin--[acetyl-CoA-carboxylase] ligase [Ruminococcaceae bacterium]|nr:biotin--[acetyl-CoA-carboxylase] ligase [Oscillospiraceae bacterium]